MSDDRAPSALTDRDGFMLLLVREVIGRLEHVMGREAAEGYLSLVGVAVAERLERDGLERLGVDRLSRRQAVDLLVDLHHRIGGDFTLDAEASSPDRLVLRNSRCPFGVGSRDHPSVCALTSSVFGYVAAQSQGAACVTLDETIARGASRCQVTLAFGDPTDDPGGTSRRHYRRGDV